MARASKVPAPKPCVVIDTREKAPWSFNTDNVDLIIDTLHTGDYSLWGHTEEVCLERKSINDFVGTIVNDYWRKPNEEPKRFERELQRMRSFVLRAIIVEGSWADLRDARYISRVHPSAIFAATCCLQVDHQVPVLMCHDRAIAGRVAERMIVRYAQNIERARLECLNDSH